RVLPPPRIGLGEPDRVDAGGVHRARVGEDLVERFHRELHDADPERRSHLADPFTSTSAPSVAPKRACTKASCANTRPLASRGGHAPERRSGWKRSTTAIPGQRTRFSISAASTPARRPRRPTPSNAAPKTA